MKRRFLSFASLLAGLLIVAVALHRTGTSVQDLAFQLSPAAHIAALTAFTIDLLARGVRLTFISRAIGRPLRVETAMLSQLAADAAGAVTPSRVGSDPAKALLMRRDRIDLASASATMVGEITAEIIVLLTVTSIASALLPRARPAVLGALIYASVVLFTVTALTLATRIPRKARPPRLWLRCRLHPRQWRTLRVAGRRFRRRLRVFLRLDRTTLAIILALTLLHMSARLSILPLLANGAAPGSAMGTLVAWPLLLLYGGAVLPPPGGGGVIELSFLAALRPVLPGGALAADLMWWRVYTFYLGAALGGIVLAFAGQRRSGRTA